MNLLAQLFKPGPTSVTARLIVSKAHEARGDYGLRQLVENITRRVAARDQLSEVLACYHWLLKNCRYLNDPKGVELVRDARAALASGQLDCDDFAVVMGAFALLLGREIRVATGGFASAGPHQHTWVEVNVAGRWVACDPVAGSRTPRMLGSIRSFSFFR